MLVFFSPFGIAITSLWEERELIFVFVVHLFNLRLFSFVCFLFLLVSVKGCGLWLWHSLDFSLTSIWILTILTLRYGHSNLSCRTNQTKLIMQISDKSKTILLWKQRTHKLTKIGDSVWLSLFICNTVVCRLKRYSIFKITRMSSIIPKEIKYNLHYDDLSFSYIIMVTETS